MSSPLALVEQPDTSMLPDLDATTDAENCPPCARVYTWAGERCTKHADFIMFTAGHNPGCGRFKIPMCESDMAAATKGIRCYGCKATCRVVGRVVI